MAEARQGPAPKIAVVLGTLNRLDQLRRAIDSIVAQTSIPYVIYVTDAGSDDGTVDYLKSIACDRIVPILVGKRLGQATAYNQVFDMVRAPYVCWLSDDNEIVNECLTTAVGILDGDTRIGMVGLKVKDSVGPFANTPYIGGMSKFGILNVNQGVLPTAVMREVGGFSEAFRDYGIDPDLTAKVLLAGYDVVYTRSISILHYRNWETDASSPEYARMQERQRAYLDLYDKTYASHFGSDPLHFMRRVIWKALRTVLGVSLTSERKFLGLIARDWHNAIVGRFTKVLWEVRTRDTPYHLRQWSDAPRRSPSRPTT
jgi:GT2 family glycosyltransferase